MRRALWAVIALTIVAALAGLWLTARRITPRPPAPPVAPEIQVKFDRITVRGRAEGDRIWELEAESIEVTKDQTITRLDGLRRAVLYSAGKPQLSVRAKWAILRSPSRDMELGGGVEVLSVDVAGAAEAATQARARETGAPARQPAALAPAPEQGLRLRTESLRWRAAEERLDTAGPVDVVVGNATIAAPRAYYLAQREMIVCEGRVKIRQGDDYLSANKLVADLRAETLDIVGGVRMRVRVAEGQELTGAEGPLGAMKGLLEKAPKEKR